MKITDGFLILNKSKGCTSFDCIRQVRKLFNMRKVGHSGTLDPEVTGVLPVALGSATKFIQYLPQEKSYIGTIKLGIKTNTDDIHGEIVRQKEWPKLSFDELDKILDNFRGNFRQIPPLVSSVHVKGERAYAKSRRNEQFELPSKEVNVHKLLLKDWNQDNGKLKIEVLCSSGTYIRSIARDLGNILKSEGCLYDLHRIKASGFHEINSFKFENICKIQSDIQNLIIPISSALDHLPKIFLKTDQETLYWQTGRKINLKAEHFSSNSNKELKERFLIFNNANKLLGIGIYYFETKSYLQPKLVLNAK